MLYQEQEMKRRLALALAGLAVVLIVIELATGFALNGWGIVLSPFLLIAAGVVFSRGMYNQIKLTNTTLRIGRNRYVPSDFDAGYGVRPRGALTDEEMSHVLTPLPIPESASIVLAGGSWAKPELPGYELLVMSMTKQGKKLVVVTRDEETLAPLLLRWLESPAH